MKLLYGMKIMNFYKQLLVSTRKFLLLNKELNVQTNILLFHYFV